MKRCELCRNPAKIHCEADGASLCSNCDEKVHSANFLVAKHTRNLLCQVCQSQTPWKASGPRLGSTVSVCNTCVESSSGENQGRREGDETDVDEECSVDDSHEELSESGEDEDADEDEDEDGGDNQVVPWSWSSMMPLPLPSSSSNREVVSSCLSSKRIRENTDLDSEDDIGCNIALRFNHNIVSMAPSSPALENDEASSLGYFKSMKFKRPNETI